MAPAPLGRVRRRYAREPGGPILAPDRERRARNRILHGPRDLHARLAELLELHQRHRPRGVLEQRLVHAQRDRRAGAQLTLGEVLAQDLAGEVLRHAP